MAQLIDTLLILALALNFFVLGVSRVRSVINAVALQGVLIGFLPVLVPGEIELREVLLAAASVGLKGVVIPRLLFHAMRGLAAARGEPLPEVPVVSGPSGELRDYEAAVAVLEAALAVTDDGREMPAILAAVRDPYAKYLGFLRNEVGRIMRGS